MTPNAYSQNEEYLKKSKELLDLYLLDLTASSTADTNVSNSGGK